MARKIISWGVGDGRISPPPLGPLGPQKLGWPNQPPAGPGEKSSKIAENVVLSNYSQLHRDQRPQISGITCLTRFFWIFDRKIFFSTQID